MQPASQMRHSAGFKTPLVGIDACILIEAVRLQGRRSGPQQTLHPSVEVLDLAQSHDFRLFLVDGAETEARIVLRLSGQEVALDVLLGRCELIRGPAATG